MRLTCVVGARPNFPKVAPILEAAAARPSISCRLVHTGQHYDQKLSTLFFEQLGLPEPDVYLGVGSGSHAVQTARVMTAFDEVLDREPTDVVVVVGDVNSTLACALVAAKRGIRVAHVEAGLRSGDWSMPEEINRVLTDRLSDYLFTSERLAARNIEAEGIPADRVHFVGNVMIDTLLKHRDRARGLGVVVQMGLVPGEYAVCTLHRPSNVDTPQAAANTLEALAELSARVPTIMPLHPRTRARWTEFGMMPSVEGQKAITLVEPLGYLEFLALMDTARLVFTDSGGIQEETTALGVPCITFRESTERPITVTEGTNQLVGLIPAAVGSAVDSVLSGRTARGRMPELWDGHAGARIVAVLARNAG